MRHITTDSADNDKAAPWCEVAEVHPIHVRATTHPSLEWKPYIWHSWSSSHSLPPWQLWGEGGRRVSDCGTHSSLYPRCQPQGGKDDWLTVFGLKTCMSVFFAQISSKCQMRFFPRATPSIFTPSALWCRIIGLVKDRSRGRCPSCSAIWEGLAKARDIGKRWESEWTRIWFRLCKRSRRGGRRWTPKIFIPIDSTYRTSSRWWRNSI